MSTLPELVNVIRPTTGVWRLLDNAVESFKLLEAGTFEFFIEWISPQGHNLTLVYPKAASSAADAKKWVTHFNAQDFVKVGFDGEGDDVWMKCHPSPHPEAKNPEGRPYGSPMQQKKLEQPVF